MWISPAPMLGMGVSSLLVNTLFFDKMRKREIKTLKQEILQLTHSDDVRAVPVLLDEFSNRESEVRLAVRAGLLRLLPKLQATDAPRLNAKQREILYALPFTREFHHEAFRLAALYAIGQIGDRRALRLMQKNGPALQNYAHVRKRYADVHATNIATALPNPRYPLLKAAVDNCIAAIEARLAAEHSGATLLRGSRQPADLPETLLRPVAASDATAPRQLLRPAPPAPDADA